MSIDEIKDWVARERAVVRELRQRYPNWSSTPVDNCEILLAEVERLTSTVAHLPLTADGEPIWPQREVYERDGTPRRATSFTTVVSDRGYATLIGDAFGWIDSAATYSTPQKAREAKR